MSLSKKEWQQEQQRVDFVVQEVTERIKQKSEVSKETKKEIVGIRRHFWDDVSVNLEDATEAIETAASLKQQAEILADRERRHRLAEKQIQTLLRLKDSPYFGRIDLREEGDNQTDVIYLGIASLMDRNEEEFLIYDWRAPISSLYYDFSPGDVYYETPEGIIKGKMERKRQFVIKHGQIQSLFDTQTTIGDELLQQVLGRQADTQMKSIVATIQKEQNRLIRDEKSRLIVVQGAAGSGKTSAALQRIAYLLYRDRQKLQAKKILLFSPNALFSSYISTVLPELGEENMQQATLQQYLEKHLGTEFELEDVFSQMEYLLSHPKDDQYQVRMEGILFKSSLVFMQWIDNYINWLKTQGMVFKDLVFQDQVLISGEELYNEFYREALTRSIPSRLARLVEWTKAQLEERVKAFYDSDWVEEEIEALSEETYTKIHRQLQKQRRYNENTFDDLRREQEMLAQHVIKKKMKCLYQKIHRWAFVDVQAIYQQLFMQRDEIDQLLPKKFMPLLWKQIAQQTNQALRQKHLFYEDAVPYLYIKEKITGQLTDRSIRHLFIDEAQDYSPFQLVFLHRLFPRSKMTVLGDINQAIYAHSFHKQNDFLSFATYFEQEQVTKLQFTRTYRSTKQIMEFAKQLLPQGQKIIPFERMGALPTLTYVNHETEREQKIVECIQKWQTAKYENIAIICKTAKESERVANRLQQLLPISHIRKETGSFQAGVKVIPSYLAKGVEFDAVIVYDASDQTYADESERKLFYTVCTRAMHELQLYSLGAPTPFVKQVTKDTWQVEGREFS